MYLLDVAPVEPNAVDSIWGVVAVAVVAIIAVGISVWMIICAAKKKE